MNATVAVVAFFLVPLFILLAESKRRRSIKSKIPLLPTLPGLPFIGNIHQLGSLPQHALRELSKKHGSLMLLHLGSIPTLVVSSPQHAQEFVKTHDTIFASRPSSKVSKLLSYNNIDIAFSPYGDCWRQMRRIGMTHLFSQKMVQSFSSIRKEEMACFLDRIADSALKNNGVVCITEMFTLYVSSILCRVVLGSSMSDEKRRLVCELAQKNSTFFSVVFFENLFPKLRWLDVLFGLEARLRNHFNAWDSLFEEFIDNHLNRHREDGDSKDTSTDFIDILLELQRGSSFDITLTREHIKATLMDMFAAGTDTSFVTLDWSMAELIRNPEVMKKARDEVREIANGKDMVSEEQLGQLKYLNAVVKEVLRLHPPIPLLLPRESSQSCEVEGYNIPKETRVIINAWAIGRDEAYWDSAEDFKPERFLGSTIDYRGKDFHYIPFGAGRRICPGMPFAISIVELTLANILLRFNWSLPRGNNHEDMNMEDSPGLVAMRKHKLELVPTLAKTN
ncbi:cytochrome P450 71A1-like [Phalaenopsis equestris]|uniref:cytochrome P450 71A1-like n=1 Tax=Phalaenopsis equestris TaxID=78828 RepID=UPI0009E2E5A8|nr:cytochrome P450 71A1-like [Phalaenopsis equestris]